MFPLFEIDAPNSIGGYIWQGAFGLLTAVLLALLGYVLYRRKYRAELHKTQTDAVKADVDTMLEIAREFPALLRKIETAHAMSLADKQTIYELDSANKQLRVELKTCQDGNEACRSLKDAVLRHLSDAEIVFVNLNADEKLLTELRRLKGQLT